jgi:hypothetical protein
MQRNYFYNSKSINENDDKEKTIQISKGKKRKVVDINILLNKVKIEQKNQIKKKVFFFSFIILALSRFGTFISITK